MLTAFALEIILQPECGHIFPDFRILKKFWKGSPSSFKFGGRIKRVLSAPKSLKGGGGERRKSLSQFFKPKSAAKVSTEVSESFTFENLSSSFNSLSLNNAASSSGTTGWLIWNVGHILDKYWDFFSNTK